jgi:hypothetical protein
LGKREPFPFFSFTRPLGEPKVPVGPLYPAQEQRGGCSTIRSGRKGGRKGGSLARRLWLWWCYWGKRRNISDGWAGGGSPQKPHPLPAVCLGRRLTVIDVRPALAVTEVKDGHGRKFLVSVLQKPEQAWTVPGREKPALRESRSPKKVQKYFISFRPGGAGVPTQLESLFTLYAGARSANSANSPIHAVSDLRCLRANSVNSRIRKGRKC